MWNNYGTKYGSRKVERGGKTYHSALEAQDAMWLESLQKEGTISELKEQVRYRCVHKGVHLWDSIVDFQFVHNGVVVWYETKGFPTKDYLLKRKFIEADIEGDVYIVNAKDLMEYMRGRTRNK